MSSGSAAAGARVAAVKRVVAGRRQRDAVSFACLFDQFGRRDVDGHGRVPHCPARDAKQTKAKGSLVWPWRGVVWRVRPVALVQCCDHPGHHARPGRGSQLLPPLIRMADHCQQSNRGLTVVSLWWRRCAARSGAGCNSVEPPSPAFSPDSGPALTGLTLSLALAEALALPWP